MPSKKQPEGIKKFRDNYRPEHDQMLIDHMAEGMSFATFGAKINRGLSTLYEWVEKHPTFKEAKDLGTLKGQEFMEKRLMAKMKGSATNGINPKEVDVTSLIFALKTRFHKTYGEKKEVENSGEIKINIDKEDLKL